MNKILTRDPHAPRFQAEAFKALAQTAAGAKVPRGGTMAQGVVVALVPVIDEVI
jgi:hypothetical protein